MEDGTFNTLLLGNQLIPYPKGIGAVNSCTLGHAIEINKHALSAPYMTSYSMHSNSLGRSHLSTEYPDS